MVLVCDDEPVVRMLVRATLDHDAYSVVAARNGDEALALTHREHPDLILLDLAMPGLSGRDVLAALRDDPATAATPVIILTGRTHATDRRALLRAGADHYLTKPFSPHQLASVVAQLTSDSSVAPRDRPKQRRSLDIRDHDASAGTDAGKRAA